CAVSGAFFRGEPGPMRGRKPKSQALHALHGTGRSGRRRLQVPPGRVTCPPWLPATAKREWKRLAPQLVELGVLTPLDVACFACYCVTVGNMIEATRRVEAEGLTYKAGDLTKRNPNVPICTAAMKDVRLFGELFGLNPLARQRFDMPEPVVEDAFEQ